MLMSAFTRARIGTSPAVKRMEAAQGAAARAAEKHRADEIERRAREAAEAERAAAAERAARAEEAAVWEARERERWAERQPDIVATGKPRWRGIVEEVAERHGLTVAELLSHGKVKRLTRPRFEVMYRIVDETSLSLPEIGRRLGGRDHTTVLNGVRRHAALTGLPLPRQGEQG